MSADVDLVGTKIVCPDCFTKNVIPPPEKKQLANPSAEDDEFEYKLAEGSDQPTLESEPMVSLICNIIRTACFIQKNALVPVVKVSGNAFPGTKH